MQAKRVSAGLLIVGAAAAVYFRFLRPWHLHWGATPEEASGEVAGDELMPAPDIVATRVVEIDATPSAILPWLVQMGPGRGGAYTHDWIEPTPPIVGSARQFSVMRSCQARLTLNRHPVVKTRLNE